MGGGRQDCHKDYEEEISPVKGVLKATEEATGDILCLLVSLTPYPSPKDMGYPTHSCLLLFCDPWVPSGVTDLCAMSLWTSLPFITKCGHGGYRTVARVTTTNLPFRCLRTYGDIIRLVKTSCRDQIFIVNFFLFANFIFCFQFCQRFPSIHKQWAACSCIYISIWVGTADKCDVLLYFFYVACWIYKDWVCNVHTRVKHKTDIRICASWDKGRQRKWKRKLSCVAGQMF